MGCWNKNNWNSSRKPSSPPFFSEKKKTEKKGGHVKQGNPSWSTSLYTYRKYHFPEPQNYGPVHEQLTTRARNWRRTFPIGWGKKWMLEHTIYLENWKCFWENKILWMHFADLGVLSVQQDGKGWGQPEWPRSWQEFEPVANENLGIVSRTSTLFSSYACY